MTWHDRWRLRRNAWLASPRFQRLAARWPITRPIARRRAHDLFQLMAGFVYSQVLLTCVRLGLFERMHQAPMTVEAVATLGAFGTASADRLLRAAAALQLVEQLDDGRYTLGALGAPMASHPGLCAMVEHHAALYADLADPLALLRGTNATQQLAAYWPYANTGAPDALPDDSVAKYSALMTASQPLVADQILDSHNVSGHRRLLDIGGGEGRFLMAAAARAPALQLSLFDLPAVAARARVALDGAGLGDRARTHGGDFFHDPLPEGADLITLVRVVHDHDDDRIRRLLASAYQAMAPGGTLLLAEPMADTQGVQGMGDAYFGMYLLAMGRGQPRTREQLTALLQQAGFTGVRVLPTTVPLQTRVLRGHKPTAD